MEKLRVKVTVKRGTETFTVTTIDWYGSAEDLFDWEQAVNSARKGHLRMWVEVIDERSERHGQTA